MRRRKEKNYAGIVMSIFIAVIMITSIAGLITSNHGSQAVRYEGLKFNLLPQGWQTKYEGKTYVFSYPPTDVEFLTLPSTINLDNIVQVDVSYYINETDKEYIAQSIFELTNALSQRGIFVRPGFTTNVSNLPIITCEDATSLVPVIFYESANTSSVVHEDNCITIRSSDGFSFVSYTDRIVYEALGII